MSEILMYATGGWLIGFLVATAAGYLTEKRR